MNVRRAIAALLLPFSLVACLGTVNIGGTVSGLPSGSSVTLQNNGKDNLTVTADGAFSFNEGIADGERYSVTVLTQPVGATCAVTAGSGSVSDTDKDISSVVVTCTATSSVTGTVTGLTTGLFAVLTNAGVDVTVTSNTTFAFPGNLASGAAYAVTVKTQPLGQTCTVTKGSGTFTPGTATGVVVTCA